MSLSSTVSLSKISSPRLLYFFVFKINLLVTGWFSFFFRGSHFHRCSYGTYTPSYSFLMLLFYKFFSFLSQRWITAQTVPAKTTEHAKIFQMATIALAVENSKDKTVKVWLAYPFTMSNAHWIKSVGFNLRDCTKHELIDMCLFLCTEVDHCYNNPCLNNGTCTNSVDSYYCSCFAGFTGQNCEGKPWKHRRIRLEFEIKSC